MSSCDMLPLTVRLSAAFRCRVPLVSAICTTDSGVVVPASRWWGSAFTLSRDADGRVLSRNHRNAQCRWQAETFAQVSGRRILVSMSSHMQLGVADSINDIGSAASRRSPTTKL